MKKIMLSIKNFKTGLLLIIILLLSFPLNATDTLVPKTDFQIDGNKAVDDPATPLGAGTIDWLSSFPTTAGLTPDGYPTTGVYYMHEDLDPCDVVAPETDDVAINGQKAEDGPIWLSQEAGAPLNKSDLLAISLAAEKVSVPDGLGGYQINDIFYASFERCGGTGTMSTLLYFDDGDNLYPGDGNDPPLVPVDLDGGDFMFRFDFNPNNGSTDVSFFIRSAGDVVNPTGTWDIQPTPTSDQVEGEANQIDGYFGEVALNLTTLGIVPSDDCRGITATGHASTISGGSLQSDVKDLIVVTPVKVSNCGNLEVQKLTNMPDYASDEIFHYIVSQIDNETVHTDDLKRLQGTGTTDEVPTYDGFPLEIDSEISPGGLHEWDFLLCQEDYTITEDILATPWAIESCECTYYDIFDPTGLNPVSVLIVDGGIPTGNMFTIPPKEYHDAAGVLQPVPTTRCVITNKIGADFDDLPASYDPIGGDPASAVRSGVFIGADVTVETAGWDDVAANMDTDNGIVGSWPKWSGSTAVPVPCTGLLENGVSGTVNQNDNTYCFTVKATNGSDDPAQLVAWIDWNLNGVFDDPAERSVVLTDGSTGNVPAGATDVDVVVYWNGVTKMTDPTYARLRITTDASYKSSTSPSPIGATGDGEVEGYRIPENSLPVELTSFTTVATLTGIQVEWTTQSETENLGYILERKTGDDAWQEIASYKTNEALLGQGTVNSATDYKYLDDLVQANTTYEYRLADVDFHGVITYQATRTVKADNKILTSKIKEFTVLPAYPNPFNPVTTINYGLDIDNHVTVDIYNISGNLVTTLVNEDQTQGWHSVIWNGTNRHGKSVPAGMYLSKVSSGTQVKTSKLMLLK